VNQKTKTSGRPLRQGAAELGLKLGKRELALFERYTEELLAWSHRVNLTGHRDPEKIEVFHYLDCLSLLTTGLLRGGQRVLDVGSGAGFPGIPLKIVEPGLEMVLLEPSGKRAVFLRYMIRTLGLDGVEVLEEKAEDLDAAAGSFDRILCRAVGSMAKICSWTAARLAPGGCYLFQKSRRVDRELQILAEAVAALGLTVQESRPLEVPFLDHSRLVIVVEKTRG